MILAFALYELSLWSYGLVVWGQGVHLVQSAFCSCMPNFCAPTEDSFFQQRKFLCLLQQQLKQTTDPVEQQDTYGMEDLWCDSEPQTAMQMLSDGEFHRAASIPSGSLNNEADSFLVTDDPAVTGAESEAKDASRSLEQNVSSAGSAGEKRKHTDSPSWPGWKGAEWTGVVEEDVGSILNHYKNGELAEKYPHIPVLQTWPSKIKCDKVQCTYPNLAKIGEDAAARFSIALEDDVFAPRYFVRYSPL